MRALELSVRGFTQVEIAAELGVTQAAVSKILNRIETRVLKDRIALVERQRTRQTLRLEHLYSEGMRAWERSKSDSTRRRQRKLQDGRKQGPTIAELVVESEHGNPQFLEVARKALADLRRLWGINAPEDVNVAAPPENPYADLTHEELRQKLMGLMQILMWETSPVPSQAPVPEDSLEARMAAYAAVLERRKQSGEGP
jgi:DNA-binding MarR family transcriptional regulator